MSFNIRVYGILIDEHQYVLVSDELIKGHLITKLPGGGLAFGEGTREGLAREFLEETGLEVKIGNHLYTTDFFQRSAFNNQDQIISIYYFVHCDNTNSIKTSNKKFDFTPIQIADVNLEAESFRWVKMEDITENTMSLPIDKVAIKILKNQH